MRITVVVITGLLGACKEEPPPPPPPRPTPPPLVPIVSPQTVATSQAYDLVATKEGALLFYSPNPNRGQGIFVVELDAMGSTAVPPKAVIEFPRPKGNDAVARLPQLVVALDADAHADTLALAWIQQHHMNIAAHGAVGNRTTMRFSRPVRMARGLPAMVRAEKRPVRVTLSDTQEATVMTRGRDGKCPDGGRSRVCATYRSGRLRARKFRRRMPLVVPRPCPQAVTAGVYFGASWYFGVCAEGEVGPTTTLYSITFDPAYAHAETLRAGGQGVELVRAPEGVVVLARQSSETLGYLVTSGTDGARAWGAVQRGVYCEESVPVVHLTRKTSGGLETLIKLPLTEPRSEVVAWLPDTLQSGDETRAVWTGKALLVGSVAAGEVRVARHECRDGILVRTDI